MNASGIDDLIARHLEEASGGQLDCSVSELGRGECTSRNYFIFKVDLVGSTQLLKRARPATYARIAHAYLSTVDRITQECGAEAVQTEYHGDSVLAFFPERGNAADLVLTAAVRTHYAVNRLRHLVANEGLRAKVLLHFARLVVAKIGPWNESHRVALGIPIHYVANKEKELNAGVIWTSDDFARELGPAIRQKLLTRRHVSKTTIEMVPEEPPPAPQPGPLSSGPGSVFGGLPGQSLGNLLAGGSPPASSYKNDLIGALARATSPPPPLVPPVGGLFGAQPRMVAKNVTRQETDGYTVKILPAYQDLGFPLAVLG